MKRLFLLLLLAGSARADGPPDVIQLHDGTILLGRLTEWRPDSHAIIVLLNGESRSVEWADIEKATGPTLANASVPRPSTVAPCFEPLRVTPPCLEPPHFSLTDPTNPLTKRRKLGSSLIIAGLTPMLLGAIYTGVGSAEGDLPVLRNTFVGLGSVLFVAGLATEVAGIVLYSKAKQEEARLEVRPGGVAISGRF